MQTEPVARAGRIGLLRSVEVDHHCFADITCISSLCSELLPNKCQERSTLFIPDLHLVFFGHFK